MISWPRGCTERDVGEVAEYLLEQRRDDAVVELVHGAGLETDALELERAQWSRRMQSEHEPMRKQWAQRSWPS